MSLFQCHNCGCVENTATSLQGFWMVASFDWTGKEELRGKRVCSACGPTKFRNGEPTGYGSWHDVFKRRFLPKGMFETNREGNLEHIETGETDYSQYIINKDET
jgi:hypothetical protein